MQAGLCEAPLIYAVEEEGAFLGYVIDHPYEEGSVEIGWVLFPEYWGKAGREERGDRMRSGSGGNKADRREKEICFLRRS